METEYKKKILYVITKSNFGGAQRYVFDLATAMKDKGHEVTVAFGGTGLLKTKLESAGIRTYSIKNFERDINAVKEVHAMRELTQIIRAERPAVVHLNSSKAGGSGALIARLLGVPHIIFTAHGWAFLEERSLIWKSAVWCLSWMTTLLAHTVIVVSQNDRAHMRMPFVSKKIYVVHTAVPTIPFLTREQARASLFSKATIDERAHDFWLVATSELTSNKNLSVALEAIATFNATHERKIFFTMIGTGELHDSLEARVQTLGLQNAVTFTGYIDNAPIYLKAFDAFILPSLKEGLPYGILEAGASGIPCIASRVGGIPEIITDRESGFLLHSTKPEEIVSALHDIVTNPERAQKYAHTLQEKVAHDFLIQLMLDKTEALYTHSRNSRAA